MAKNTVIIFELTSQNAEIRVIGHTAKGYRYMVPTLSDASLGANQFVEQLVSLAIRKAGKQPQQMEPDKSALLAEAQRCRKELEEFDTEFNFPDGVAVEIEAYEYENACAGLMNRVREVLDKMMGRPAEVDKLVVLAADADMVLLKPWLIRNYGASVGFGRAEEEWLLVNDRPFVSQLLAGIKRTTSGQPSPRPAQRRRTAKPASAPAPSQAATHSRRSPWIFVVLGCVAALGVAALVLRKSRTSYDDSDEYEPETELQDTYNTEYESEAEDVFAEGYGQEAVGRSDNSQPSSEAELKRRYDYVYSESNGLRKVEKNGKKGFVDSRGREVVAPIYDYIYSPSDGLYKVEKDGKKGYIRKDGTVFIAIKYDYIYSKSDGVYKVEAEGKKGFVDARTGKELCPPKYDYIYSKSNDLYKVELNGKKGFINARFQEIVPPKYDYIYSFSGGLAKVEQNGKVGYINKEGKLVQPLE